MPTATGARFYASASIVVVCAGCGCSRTVSARHARRAHLGVCRDCQRAPLVPPVDDEARAFWLCRFSDEEIADLAGRIFRKPIDPATIAAQRQRLFGGQKEGPPSNRSSRSAAYRVRRNSSMTRHRRSDLRAALEPLFAAQRERLRRPWFAPVEWASPLAAEIASVLAEEPHGLPLAELARRLRRRHVDLREILRRDARFTDSGSTRGRRWQLVAQERRRGARDGMGRNLPAVPDSEASEVAP